jgi:hypothetical protein
MYGWVCKELGILRHSLDFLYPYYFNPPITSLLFPEVYFSVRLALGTNVMFIKLVNREKHGIPQ